MRSNRTAELFKKMVLVVSLLFGVVAFAGTTAQAQRFHHRGGRVVIVQPRPFFGVRFFGPRYRYGYSPYFYPSSHVTEGQGYNDGLHDGREDAKKNKGYDPQRHHDLGDSLTSAYTEAYLRGYADGFRERAG
jgi:hypothetical protein